jgi:hypothetical protein
MCAAIWMVGSPQVRCGPGDVLLINTRLWRHATALPCTRAAAASLSVVRFSPSFAARARSV